MDKDSASYMGAENGDNDAPSISVIADGPYLRDLSGNIVGTLNEDGTYSLVEGLSPQSLLDDPSQGTQNEDVSQTIDPNSLLTSSVQNQPIETKPMVATGNPLAASKSLIKTELNNTGITSISSGVDIGGINVSTHSSSGSSVQTVKIETSKPGESITITTPVSNKGIPSGTQSSKGPLGSSANPIRIIQQGNTYTSTQELTQEQLAQIMQVVQQQQALKEAQEAGHQKVIYNPKTQTKIVYKVVNPSQSVGPRRPPGSGGKFNRKRPRSKQSESDEDDQGPELSYKEKEERRKKIPKTRSGRISKPPKHMIEDYKHIHLVDWKEDYDDSDAGYSDYKGETDEEEREAKQMRYQEEKRKREDDSKGPSHKCNECGQIFNSRKGLNIHYENQPSHKPSPGLENGDDRASRRMYAKNSKRYKLKELMSRCPDEVILDVMLPKLCSIVNVWEFMLMKIEDEHPDTDVTFPMIYKEFEEIRIKVKQAFEENISENHLERADDIGGAGDEGNTKWTQMNIKSEESAKSLGVQPGVYRVVQKEHKRPDFMMVNSKLKTESASTNSPSVGSVKTESNVGFRQESKIKQENKVETFGAVKNKVSSAMSGASASSSSNITANISIQSTPIVQKTTSSATRTPTSSRGALTTSQAVSATRTNTNVKSTPKTATGVVSDMSDLDVWDSRSCSSAAVSSTNTSTSASSRTVALREPTPSKMVSIISRQPSRGTVQIGTPASTSRDQTMSSVAAVESTSNTISTQGSNTIKTDEGDLEIPEGVQMVIQHPDGSYQLIDNPEEARKLMEQAEMMEQGESQIGTDQEQMTQEQATQEQIAQEQTAAENTDPATGYETTGLGEEENQQNEPSTGAEPTTDTMEGLPAVEMKNDSEAMESIADALISAATAVKDDSASNAEASMPQVEQNGETWDTENAPMSEEDTAGQLASLNSAEQPGLAFTSAEQAAVYTSGQDQVSLLQSQTTDATGMTMIEEAATPVGESAPEATSEATGDGQGVDPNSQTLVFQTDDGLILIRQPDGNFQVQSTTGAPINMNTVRALINSLQLM